MSLNASQEPPQTPSFGHPPAAPPEPAKEKQKLEKDIIQPEPLLDNSFYFSEQSFANFLKKSRQHDPLKSEAESEESRPAANPAAQKTMVADSHEVNELTSLLEQSIAPRDDAAPNPVSSLFASVDPLALVSTDKPLRQKRLSDFVHEVLKKPVTFKADVSPRNSPKKVEPTLAVQPNLPAAGSKAGREVSERAAKDFQNESLIADTQLLEILDTKKADSPPQGLSTSPLTKTFCEASVFDQSVVLPDKARNIASIVPDKALAEILELGLSGSKKPPGSPLKDEQPPKKVVTESGHKMLVEEVPKRTTMPVIDLTRDTATSSALHSKTKLTEAVPKSQLSHSGKSTPQQIYNFITAEREQFARKMQIEEPHRATPAHSKPKVASLKSETRRIHAELDAYSSSTYSADHSALFEQNLKKYNVDTATPNLKYVLTLKIFQCLLVSSQINNLKNFKQKLTDIVGRASTAVSSLLAHCTTSVKVSDVSPKEQLFAKLFKLRVTSVMTSIHGDELLQTFLFRNELVVIVRLIRATNQVGYMLLYLSDGGDTGKVLRSALERSLLTDYLLRRFKSLSKARDMPHLFECLAFLCEEFAAYADMLQTLKRLRAKADVSHFSLGKDGELRLRITPKVFCYVDFYVRLKKTESGWAAEFEEFQTDKRVALLAKRAMEELRNRMTGTIVNALKSRALDAAKAFETAVGELHKVATTCFKNIGVAEEDKSTKISDGPRTSQ